MKVSKVFLNITSLQYGSKVRYLDEESVLFNENTLKWSYANYKADRVENNEESIKKDGTQCWT